MDPIKFNCLCKDAASKWCEEPDDSPHSFRVECGRCGKFIKWGKDVELHYRVAARHKVTVEMIKDRPKPATLEKWIISDDN